MIFKSAIAGLGVSFGLVSFVAAGDYQNAVRVLDTGDSVAAAQFLKSCAGQGETRCEVALASFYQRGEGVGIDHRRAFELYDRAARKGDAIAQLNLAEIYENGIFVAADKSLAYIWYSLAAEQGKDWAAKRAEKLVLELSEAERAAMPRRKARIRDNL